MLGLLGADIHDDDTTYLLWIECHFRTKDEHDLYVHMSKKRRKRIAF